ncbi:Hypothetical predicted protein [Octopus vulgaris]|uniref:Uncharacterized protein n=1 Tax=Octopus vulgaris TaxID=6645 RepID=A0AA36AZM3_OCTVU|nr:Hypothetical predicted protein [Octopus vulgaris]
MRRQMLSDGIYVEGDREIATSSFWCNVRSVIVAESSQIQVGDKQHKTKHRAGFQYSYQRGQRAGNRRIEFRLKPYFVPKEAIIVLIT